MATGDFNYKGSQAQSIYDSFIDNAVEAKKAYDAAVADWSEIKDYLSVTGSQQKMEDISEFHSGEIEKVIKNIESMETSLTNVAKSWDSVAAEVNEAIDTYYKKDGE